MSEDKFMSTLQDALDVAPSLPVEEAKRKKERETQAEAQADDDYNYTKEKIKDMLEIAMEVLEDSALTARENHEARSVEAFSNVLGQTKDLANSILQASKTKADIDKTRASIGPEKTQVGQITQNNSNVFIGSSKEILQKLKQNKIVDAEAVEIINANPTE